MTRSTPHDKIECVLLGFRDQHIGYSTVYQLRRMFPPGNTHYWEAPSEEVTLYPIDTSKLQTPAKMFDALIPHFSLIFHGAPWSWLPKTRYDQADVVHTIQYRPLIRTEVPKVVEMDQHYGDWYETYRGIPKDRMRFTLRVLGRMLLDSGCRMVLTYTQVSSRNIARDLLIPAGMIKVLPPPMPSRRRSPPPPDNFNILFIGREFPRKGGDVAVELYQRLKAKFPRVRLFYIGKIDEKRRAILEKNPGCFWYESLPNEVLHREIFPKGNVLLLPTRADAYGLAILEAMSYGIPAVCTRIPQLAEIVEDGTNGYLFDRDDIDTAEEILSLLIADERHRTQLEEGALDFIRQNHAPGTVAGKLARIYRDVLS